MSAPTEIIQGDSKTWTANAAVTTERMTYSFRDGDGSGTNVDGINDGAGTHTFTVSLSDSANLKPGWYDVSKSISYADGTRVTSSNAGRCRIVPDPAAEMSATDAENRLSALRTEWDKRVTHGMTESRSIGGLSVTKVTMDGLRNLIRDAEITVMREKMRGRRLRGRTSGASMKVKF